VKTYLAAGIPTIASPVGHHAHLIHSGENGILATTANEWVESLSKLLTDVAFAQKLSRAARESAIANYSHEVLMPILADKLRDALPQLGTRGSR
jgi:glycosyltransferase involved in cell wall biosynthesis